MKKAAKKLPKKPAAAARSRKKRASPGEAEGKLVGEITHFYGGLGVAIVKCKAPISVGDKLRFKGVTTDFEEAIGSMQYDHKPIEKAKKGQEVGIQVHEKVREGDEVYLV